MNYELDDCIASKMRILSRTVDNIYRKHLKGTGITESQLNILFVIRKMNELEVSKIGVMLQLEISSISRNLTRLIDQKLIIKKKKGNTGYISLTEAGNQIVDRLIPKWQQAMDETIHKIGNGGYGMVNVLYQKVSN